MTPLKRVSFVAFILVGVILLAILIAHVWPSTLLRKSFDSGGNIDYPTKISPVEFVSGDQILDEYGNPVMWRGGGGSYLMHSDVDYMAGWRAILSDIQYCGFNTWRLAFRFPWDIYNATADVLDLAKMDDVVNFLAQNGIKSILDFHIPGGTLTTLFDPRLVTSWEEVAEHYCNNSNVVAYELYNEPRLTYGDTLTDAQRLMNNAEAYRNLTLAIRTIDPNHICIWQTPDYYIPPFDQIANLMLPNVVYTAHEWGSDVEQQELYGPLNLSRMIIDKLLEWRQNYSIPIWLGEFGCDSGPYSYYNATDPQWRVCEQLLYRCEEQVIPWNLWMGFMTPTNDRLENYKPLFPLKIFSKDLVRQPWTPPSVPRLSAFITSMNGVDVLQDYELEMWHGGDYVTFEPGIAIRIIMTQVLANGTSEDFTSFNNVTQTTTIENEEGTVAYPGDWNIRIDSLGYA